ncbi:MAG: hypothetical protein ACJAVG_001133 [Rickettsiales bacterium]|jgi:hypothetical protein
MANKIDNNLGSGSGSKASSGTNKSKKVNKTKLAKSLGVSRQGLYYKPKLPDKDLELKSEIEEVLKEHKAYGYRRIALHLGINHKRALRVMKLFNLSPIRKIKIPIKKKDSKQKEMPLAFQIKTIQWLKFTRIIILHLLRPVLNPTF